MTGSAPLLRFCWLWLSLMSRVVLSQTCDISSTAQLLSWQLDLQAGAINLNLVPNVTAVDASKLYIGAFTPHCARPMIAPDGLATCIASRSVSLEGVAGLSWPSTTQARLSMTPEQITLVKALQVGILEHHRDIEVDRDTSLVLWGEKGALKTSGGQSSSFQPLPAALVIPDSTAPKAQYFSFFLDDQGAQVPLKMAIQFSEPVFVADVDFATAAPKYRLDTFVMDPTRSSTQAYVVLWPLVQSIEQTQTESLPHELQSSFSACCSLSLVFDTSQLEYLVDVVTVLESEPTRCLLFLSNNLFADVSGNLVASTSIVHANVASTIDIVAPTLESWSLELRSMTLSLSFSEPVRLGPSWTHSNNATLLPREEWLTLSLLGNANQPGRDSRNLGRFHSWDAGLSQQIRLDMVNDDFVAVKNTILLTSSSSPALSFPSGLFIDGSGLPCPAVSGSTPQSVLPDDSPPMLVAAKADRLARTLSLQFDDIVEVASFDPRKVVLQRLMQPGGRRRLASQERQDVSYTLTGGNVVLADKGFTVIIRLSRHDRIGISKVGGLLQAKTLSTLILVHASAVKDAAGNSQQVSQSVVLSSSQLKHPSASLVDKDDADSVNDPAVIAALAVSSLVAVIAVIALTIKCRRRYFLVVPKKQISKYHARYKKERKAAKARKRKRLKEREQKTKHRRLAPRSTSQKPSLQWDDDLDEAASTSNQLRNQLGMFEGPALRLAKGQDSLADVYSRSPVRLEPSRPTSGLISLSAGASSSRCTPDFSCLGASSSTDAHAAENGFQLGRSSAVAVDDKHEASSAPGHQPVERHRAPTPSLEHEREQAPQARPLAKQSRDKQVLQKTASLRKTRISWHAALSTSTVSERRQYEAEARASFAALEVGELSVHRGELLEIKADSQRPGWVVATNAHGDCGIVPIWLVVDIAQLTELADQDDDKNEPTSHDTVDGLYRRSSTGVSGTASRSARQSRSSLLETVMKVVSHNSIPGQEANMSEAEQQTSSSVVHTLDIREEDGVAAVPDLQSQAGALRVPVDDGVVGRLRSSSDSTALSADRRGQGTPVNTRRSSTPAISFGSGLAVTNASRTGAGKRHVLPRRRVPSVSASTHQPASASPTKASATCFASLATTKDIQEALPSAHTGVAGACFDDGNGTNPNAGNNVVEEMNCEGNGHLDAVGDMENRGAASAASHHLPYRSTSDESDSDQPHSVSRQSSDHVLETLEELFASD